MRIAPPGHPVRAVVLCSLANRLLTVWRSDEAEEAAAEALDIARAADDARIEALALIVLATCRVRRGDLVGELPRLAEAEQAAARLGAHGVRLQAVFAEATVLVAFGEYGRTAERARHGIAVAESIGLARTYGAIGGGHLASALIGQGQWDEATSAVEHALDHTPAPVLQIPLVCLRATIALARGDPVPAEQAQALTGAAEAAAADGDRRAAAVQVRRAAEIADRLGARPLREQAEGLTRRARLTLAGDRVAPGADPGEQARQQYGLTARELEVLRLVAIGRSNRDIAAELFISAKTASVHVSNIMSKLGVASRVEAAARLPLGRIGTAEAAGPAPGLAAANCRVCAGLLPGLRPCRGVRLVQCGRRGAGRWRPDSGINGGRGSRLHDQVRRRC